MTVVDPAGNVVKASRTENADIFWARGTGGGNFGIVTEFRLRLFKLPPVMVYLEKAWPIGKANGGNASMMASALSWYTSKFSSIDRRLTGWFGAYGDWASVTSLFLGTEQECDRVLNATFADAPPGWFESYRVVTSDWRDIVLSKINGIPKERWNEVLTRNGVQNWSWAGYSKHKSAHLFPEHIPLPAERLLAFAQLRDTALERGLSRPHVQLHAGDPSTRLGDADPPSSAVAWRGAGFVMQYYGEAKDGNELQEKVVPFMREMERALAEATRPEAYPLGATRPVRNATGYQYINYIDIDSARADPTVYYDDPTATPGGDTLARLAAIKRSFDPRGVFSVAGGIPTGAATSTATSATQTATVASSTARPSSGRVLKVGWGLVGAVLLAFAGVVA
ncbi:hypothetical protein DFJ74DRAFT_671676 [Hyaloraphidium curvatum]|nr:hypothetical protein DFJ74DRAFT_671676 [Hyaloraphidium curvatum]